MLLADVPAVGGAVQGHVDEPALVVRVVRQGHGEVVVLLVGEIAFSGPGEVRRAQSAAAGQDRQSQQTRQEPRDLVLHGYLLFPGVWEK